MIAIEVKGLQEFQNYLAALPDALKTTLQAKMQVLSDALSDAVKAKLDGEVLQSRTGALKDSITSQMNADGDLLSAGVSAGEDVPYAAIQEYGGVTKAHIIAAVNAKTLAFNWGGKEAFFPQVMHPGSNIPERSYMGSAFEEMQDDINDGFLDALAEAINN